MIQESYTLEELFQNLSISLSEVARRAHISGATVGHIRKGKTARLHSVNRVLRVFSEVYGTDLTIDNVTGLHILVGRYGEQDDAA